MTQRAPAGTKFDFDGVTYEVFSAEEEARFLRELYRAFVLAMDLPAATNLSIDTCIDAIRHAHERGHIRLGMDGERVVLEPVL